MIKFRLYFDKDAETEWVNSMAKEGYAMTGFFAGFFNFEKCDKGKWSYQIDFGDRFFAVSDEYREFMEEAGVEIVQTWGPWIILRKPASEGKFELYTDVDSSIEHYTKIRTMLRVVTAIELICFLLETLAAINGVRLGYIFAILFAAVLITLTNAVMKTNDILDSLNERKTGIEPRGRKRKVSILMPIGMLLLSGALLTKEYVPHAITLALELAALICELAGFFMCRRKEL